jgi:hypothetical protein
VITGSRRRPLTRPRGTITIVAALPCFYTIRIKGRLGPTALSAFPTLACQLRDRETVLTGVLADRSAVFGVVGQIESLGLELLELRCIGSDSPERDHVSR